MKLERLIFNGKKINSKDLDFYFLRRGFLYGDGIFETLLANNSKIFRFNQHWKRLENGSEICNLELPKREKVEKLIKKELEELGNGKYYIRINLWRSKPEKFNPGKIRKSYYLVIIRKFEPYSVKFYKEGIRCIVSEKIKRNEKSVLSKIKSLNYLENIILKIESKKENFDDAIVLNNSGYIVGGSVSNVFFVKNDIVFTPSLECGSLEGITRKVIFEICEKEKIELREGFFNLDFLKECKEVFLTNTLMGIMPVKEIRGYFKSENFKLTRVLSEKYNEIFLKETE
ncbi:MAG: aminotransferase class IV [Candidatus Omnitrophica bacterium]|nr:aminotransferase class IV [Candidatus Omnitrophota bacterium]